MSSQQDKQEITKNSAFLNKESKKIIRDLKKVDENKASKVEKNISESLIKCRATSIEWVLKTAEVLQLNEITIFKAISLIDNFVFSNLKGESIDMEDIKLSVIICLNIACKFEEVYSNYFNAFYKKFYGNGKGNFTKKQFVEREMEILKKINFKLNLENFHSSNLHIKTVISDLVNQEGENFSGFKEEFSKINEQVVKYYALQKESFIYSSLDSAVITIKMSFYIYNSRNASKSYLKKGLTEVKKFLKYICKDNDLKHKLICKEILSNVEI